LFEKAREELKWTPLNIERDESDLVETIKTEVETRGSSTMLFSSTKFTPPPVGGSAGEAGEGGLAPPGMRTGDIRPTPRLPENEVRNSEVRVTPREEIVQKRRKYDDEVDESDVVEEAKVTLGKLGSGDEEKRDAIRRKEHLPKQQQSGGGGGNQGGGGGNATSSNQGRSNNSSSGSNDHTGSNSPIPPPTEQSGG
jgi:hypothetical protein